MPAIIRVLLLSMTSMAVIGDALLMPFYPQFFSQRFAIDNPQSSGIYLAAICAVVMLAFPLWAHIAKKIPTLFIMFATQAVAGVLALCCYWVESWPWFWFLSLTMFMCKAGYLLIYPLLMQLEAEENHARIIGVLSVIVHFGAILGALVGGTLLQIAEPSDIYLLMATSDFIAMLLCVYLWKNHSSWFKPKTAHREVASSHTTAPLPLTTSVSSWRAYRLGVVILFFYFGAYITCPFFVSFWQSISPRQSTLWSGFVYAIPGIMALSVLWFTRKKNIQIPTMLTLSIALGIGILGYTLQNSLSEFSVIAGRIIFGVGIYYASIYLELLIFHGGDSQTYARDVSRVYFFQSLGVLLASYSAGIIVNHTNLHIPFFVGSLFLLFTALIFWRIKSHLLHQPTPATLPSDIKGAMHDF